MPVALAGAGQGSASTLFGVLAYVVIVLGLGALAALFVWLLHRAVGVMAAPLWLALPVTWTALEWVRAHLPSTLALPWLGLETTLTATPELLGIAELVGGRGVSFWIALVNGLLASVFVGVRERGAWRGPALAAAVVVTVPATWGVWRAGALDTRPVADVAVVQPNLAGRAKVAAGAGTGASTEGGAGLDRAVEVADSLVGRLDPGSVDLLVLPEMFLRDDPRGGGARVLDDLRAISRSVQAPLLFGGLGSSSTPGAGVLRYNSVFLLDSAGLAGFRYDKRRLVPVVERTPFLPWGPGDASDVPGGYAAGTHWPLATVAGARFGALVCYESSYPESARALRRAGADVLVNVTNDAWLGGADLLTRTSALWQHPAHLVVRSVENRMGAVRSANTGISLFVDPTGEVHERTALFASDVRAWTVETTDGSTPYTRYGDLLGNASALTAIFLLLLSWAYPGRIPRRERRDRPGPRRTLTRRRRAGIG